MIFLPQSLLPRMGTNHTLAMLLRGKTSREGVQYFDGHLAGWAWSMASCSAVALFSVHSLLPRLPALHSPSVIQPFIVLAAGDVASSKADMAPSLRSLILGKETDI